MEDKKIEMNSIQFKLNRINNSDIFLSLLKITKTLKNFSAKIPGGLYRGRWGKITACCLDVTREKITIQACIQPYNLITRDGDYLNDKVDARRHWDYEEFHKNIHKGIKFE
jgi:hypothetical protein